VAADRALPVPFASGKSQGRKIVQMTPDSASPRADRLRALLAQDPGNEGLRLAAATAAYEERDYQGSDELLAGLSGSVDTDHLRGLVALSLSRFDEASAVFTSLLHKSEEPTVRYNLAYALAMQGLFDEALDLLDDDVLAAVAPATTLRLRILHRLGRFDEAVALGNARLQHEDDAQLRGVVSMILFDQGDLAAAGVQAMRALDSAEGATTAGMLALENGESAGAAALFERAMERNPTSGRAMLGRGLTLTMNGAFAEAADTLETAARMMRDHSGAWVTAGWARLMQGELDAAEADFRLAMKMDPGFSEASGGLAMTLLRKDQRDDADHYARVALRLDPASFSGQFVTGLLLESAGDTDAAKARMATLLSHQLPHGSRTFGNFLSQHLAPVAKNII
jgi:tetratricopeptide (TPR) repeat protein